MRTDPKVKKLTMTALMAAVIFVVTILVKIPMPGVSGMGSLNIGDAIIYLTAALLGGPAGMIAAAIGSSLADLLTGLAHYMLPTAIVKGLMGLVCGRLMERETFARFLIASVAGGAIMVAGYAVYDTMLLQLAVALAIIPFNLVQWGVNVALAAAFYPVVPRLKRSIS